MKICTSERAVALLIAIISLLLGACSPKSEEPRIPEGSEGTQPQGTLRSIDIATIISSGDFSTSDFAALALSIQSNAEIGYDEKVYLSDLSTLRGSENSFANKLLNKLNASSLRSSSDSDFSLYWRSCKEWDGEERPVIAYVSEETPDDAKAIPALELDESGKVINTIMVDEEYTINHPTLIVGKEEKPVGQPIPLRPKGYISDLKLPSLDDLIYRPYWSKKVASLYLGDLQVERQFDSFFRGGSEICFVVSYPRASLDKNGQLHYEERTTHQFRKVTRDQIKNREILHLDYELIVDWDSNLDCIGWFAYEDDSFSAPGGKIKFEFAYKGFKFAVEATIPNSREDINRIDYTGDYLMSTANWNQKEDRWIMHNANGIKYTLPIKVSYTLPMLDGPVSILK